MADFVSVLRRAVGNLDNNSEATRQAIYGKARAALRAQLEAIEPPLGPEEVARQIKGLDEAIAALEVEFSGDDAATTPETAETEPKPSSPDSGPQPATAATATPAAATPATAAPVQPGQSMPQPASGPTRPAGGLSAPAARDHAAAAPGDSDAPSYEPTPSQPDLPAGSTPDGDAGRAAARTEYYDGDDVSEKVGSGRFVAWIILLLVVAGIAGVGFWQRDTVSEIVASLTSGEEAADEPKIADRLPARQDDGEQPAPAQAETPAPTTETSPTPAPSTPADTPPPASAADGERVAQALLVEESAAGVTPASTLGGSVDWSLVDDTEAVGGTEKVVRGTVRVPEKDLSLAITIRLNKDHALPASHLVELVFETGPGFPNEGISNVPGLIMKATPRSTGQPLVGAVVPVMDGYFLVGLSESELDQARNIEEMKSRDFIDVPIIYEDGGRAMLSLAKGETGSRVFSEAFAAWAQ